MNDNEKQIVIAELIQKEMDGLLTDQEFSIFQKMLNDDAEAVSYYVKTVLSISAFSANSIAPSFNSVTERDTQIDILNQDAWAAMAEYEKTAPEIELSQEEPQRELIRKVVYPPREKRKVSKFSIVFVAMNAAALLFFVLFLRFAPTKGGHEVATLTDSFHAKWADAAGKMVNGASIAAGDESLTLSEGYAELLFTNQAKVTIEGPAEFQVLDEDHIKLNYGRLYAMVPREAIGFMVKTPSTQIVDLGTEFGIECSLHGDTSLHVIKGKTILIAGDKSSKTSIEIKAGVGKKVYASTRTISDISCNDHLFVREIDSAGSVIWRGETEISLADIASGSNGFGETRSAMWIDPVTGEFTSTYAGRSRSSKKEYCPVVTSKFIDGVFVPDGNQDGTIPVTSLGHTFECPDTGGDFTFGIIAYKGNILKHYPDVPPAVFEGQTYENCPLLMMHSNAGITFDLQAIRQSLPGLYLENFKAQGGLTEALERVERQPPDVDFWVLVDGEIRYEKKAFVLEDGLISFNVQLSPKDRFLTLIVSDGSRPAGLLERRYSAFSNDFFYLIDPTLQIVQNEDN